jgi:addiction module HigA family antidote
VFLEPLGISQYRLAKAIGVPASRISEIITGQRAITADTDLRLCRVLGLSPGYWLRSQAAHDTELASAELERIQAPRGLLSLVAAPTPQSQPTYSVDLLLYSQRKQPCI